MRKASTVILILIVAVLAGVVASVAGGIDFVAHTPPQPPVGTGSESTASPPASDTIPPPPASQAVVSATRIPCTTAGQRLNFPSWWAGKAFDGLGVTAAIRRCDQPLAADPGRANYVSYIYGDCKPTGGDEGCAPPIEIQSWPAAELTKRMFSSATPDGHPRPGTDTTVGGIPATKYDGGEQIVIFRPQSTVMIFGTSPVRAERFAQKAAQAQGPAVPTQLAQIGLVFDRDCVTSKGSCLAKQAR